MKTAPRLSALKVVSNQAQRQSPHSKSVRRPVCVKALASAKWQLPFRSRLGGGMLAAFICVLGADATAATYTFNGASADNNLNTPGNYTLDGTTASTTLPGATSTQATSPNTPTTNFDTLLFSGAGNTSLFYSQTATQTPAYSGGNYGVNFSLTAAQTGSVGITASTTGLSYRVGDINLASGSGAFSFGASGSSTQLVLGNNSLTTFTWTNNSSNAATIGNPTSSMGTLLPGSNSTGTRTLAFAGTGDWTVGSQLVNNTGPILGLTKTGAGTLTLARSGSLYGSSTVGTVVNGGTLLVNGIANNGAGSGTGVGAVTVNNSGTKLGGTGQIAGLLTMSAGTILSPGASTAAGNVGTLTIGLTGAASGLVLNSTTSLVYDLGTSSDRIVVNGALTLAGQLTVNGGAGFGAGNYDLINYTGTLTNNGLTVASLPAGYTGTIDTTSIANEVLLDVTAVPEPATWVGGLALLVMGATAKRFRFSRAV